MPDLAGKHAYRWRPAHIDAVLVDFSRLKPGSVDAILVSRSLSVPPKPPWGDGWQMLDVARREL